MWKIHSHGGATYTPFLHILRIRGATVRVVLLNWRHLAYFSLNFATIKNFFQKPNYAHHPRTICAKFDVLRPSQS